MTPRDPSGVPKLPVVARIEYFLRSILLAIGLPLVVLYYLARGRRIGKYWPSLRERLGNIPEKLHQPGRGAIWIHAVSVGEALAVAPLVPLLCERLPGRKVFVSTTTDTGQQLAAAQISCDGTFYFPLDFAFSCRRALRAIQPELVIIAETEFWPRFLREAKRFGARVALVNGRISDRSFGRYHFFRNSMRTVLAHVDRFLMQTEEDARRMREIGAPAERVVVAGNLKYDLGEPQAAPIADWLEGEIGRLNRRPVMVAGSVSAGEELLVLIAFGTVQGQWPRALLVLAPRKPERFDIAARLAEESSRKVVRRSEVRSGATLDESASVFLLDSVGELAGLYRLADAVFVGGSLVPAGGHNILEPACFGKPPLFGPSMENFREMAANFVQAGAGIQVCTPEQLGDAWIELIQNAARREEMGRKARELVERSRGATQRTAEQIVALLAGGRS
jgi:3-deoxy-D-manno-octulosonic-acid transferase